MRKSTSFLLIIATSLLVVGCWGTKKKSDATGESGDSAKAEILYPVTKAENSKKLSELVSDNLLFDAPVSARYILSSVKELSENKIVKFDFSKDGKEEVILLSRDHPNGVRVLAERKNITQNLINDIEEGYFFDSYGELKEPNSIQVTIVDINGDNRCEVIVSIGKPGVRVDSFVFVIQDTDKGSYHYIGSISGKDKMQLTSDYRIHVEGMSGSKNLYKLENTTIMQVN